MSDLDRLHQRLAPPRLNEIKRFREVGVSPEALSSPELPARADVVFHDDRPLFDLSTRSETGAQSRGSSFSPEMTRETRAISSHGRRRLSG